MYSLLLCIIAKPKRRVNGFESGLEKLSEVKIKDKIYVKNVQKWTDPPFTLKTSHSGS